MQNVYTDVQCAIATGVLIFGIINLRVRNTGMFNRCLAVSYLALAWILYYCWFFTAGIGTYIALLINTEIPATWISGAGIYLTFTTFFSEKELTLSNCVRHLAIPVLIIPLIVLSNIATVFIVGSSPAPEFITHDFAHFDPIHLAAIASDFAFAIYTSITLHHVLRTRKEHPDRLKRFFKIMILFMAAIQLMGFLFILGRAFANPALVMNLTFILAVLLIIYSISGFGYPEYSQRIVKMNGRNQKRRLTMDKKNAESLLEKLGYFMEIKKIYQNPDLSLEDIGRCLDIPSAMVSQLVNTHAKVNFKTFLNTYRIKDICAQLVSEPDTSIIEIAFANGFNSKSTFNDAFLEITGTTPRDYRNSHTGKKRKTSQQSEKADHSGKKPDFRRA